MAGEVLAPTVRLIYENGDVLTLRPNGAPAEVPAGALVIAISQAEGPIYLDGAIVRPSRVSDERLLSVNLNRSSAYHLLIIGNLEFAFATSDGKLGLTGIVEIAKALTSQTILAWKGQVLFADDGALDTIETRAAWLWRNAARITSALESIARQPQTGLSRGSAMLATVRGKVDFSGTLAAIRRNYSLLEKRERGALALANGNRYTPSLIRADAKERTLLIPPNFEAYRLAKRSLQLFASIRTSDQGNDRTKDLGPLMDRLRRSILSDTFKRIGWATGGLVNRPSVQPEYRFDSRYALVAKKTRELRTLGWSAQHRPRGTTLAFIKHADELYQAFVTVALAEALDCQSLTDGLIPRLPGPSFQSDDFDIYYDTGPPTRILKTWRYTTDRKDEPRPDILIVSRTEPKVLIIDAKYRSSGNRASSDSLYDMQYYLNTFRLRHAVVFYPPADTSFRDINVLRGEGFAIAEVPVAPWPDLISHLRNAVVPEIKKLLEPYPSVPTGGVEADA